MYNISSLIVFGKTMSVSHVGTHFSFINRNSTLTAAAKSLKDFAERRAKVLIHIADDGGKTVALGVLLAVLDLRNSQDEPGGLQLSFDHDVCFAARDSDEWICTWKGARDEKDDMYAYWDETQYRPLPTLPIAKTAAVDLYTDAVSIRRALVTYGIPPDVLPPP